MAWTSGFFNSVNGDRLYNADQMSGIFDGLITNGVYHKVGNKLAVQPNNGMTIQINTGRGWFGGRWANNDAEYLQKLEDSDVLLNRYCAVCVRADITDSGRTVAPYFKYSEYATAPTKPTMERSETVKEYCLAYVFIKAGATEITAADIEDTRANTELCGWVTGLIEQVDTDTLWTQWQAQWENFMSAADTENDTWQEEQRTAFLDWYNNLVDYIDADVQTKLTNDVLQLQSDVTTLQGQCIKATGTFDGLSWVSHTDGSYTQTIEVQGVTAANDIMVFPTAEYKETYLAMDCMAIEQAENAITFRCWKPVDESVTVEVIIFSL